MSLINPKKLELNDSVENENEQILGISSNHRHIILIFSLQFCSLFAV